jgi:signal transduction histidine kinase
MIDAADVRQEWNYLDGSKVTRRHMDRDRSSPRTLLAAGVVVVVSLLALAFLPLIISRRAERLRRAEETEANPARDHLNRVNFELTAQLRCLARTAITGEARYLADYGAATAAERIAMQALRADVGRLGPAYVALFAQLQNEMTRWHVRTDRYVELRKINPAEANHMAVAEGNFNTVLQAVYRLDQAITRFQDIHRDEHRSLARLQINLSIALSVLALAAAVIVLWILARLRTLAASLSRESARRLEALRSEEEQRHVAESLVRSRDEILGVVSHDLRNPLTTIALSTQLIPDSSADERREHVETIVATTRRMQRLIQDLLDATKIEHGPMSIRHDPIEPESVAREAVAAHKPLAAEKDIRFESSIGTPLPALRGDRDRLLQAIANLLGNALKFTPSGGTIRFAVEPIDSVVRFTVSDTGPGIPASDMPHLFEPFWQAKKTAHLGAGLGLKITRAIVEAHGGDISVSNIAGAGACFTLELPADR